MNRLLITTLLLACVAGQSVARTGYRIRLKLSNVTDSTVYLTHYYGKPLPSIYKRDSARFNKNGEAVMESSDDSFTGGIYMILLGDRKTYFEFLLDKGNDISITGDVKDLQQSLKFKNSPENDHFQDYVHFLKGYGEHQEALKKEYAAAKTAADTAEVRKKAASSSHELSDYRHDCIKKYPGTLMASIFAALDVPHVPEGEHLLEDGKTKDSAFAYNYYKSHFWDGFNFQDDRLIHTPILDPKLEEYFSKLVVPWPDSMEKETDQLLRKARGSKEIFKYILWWATRNAESSKVMGMDEVFVYLVENYYMKGDATWLTTDELTKYTDRARKIAPNVIGNIAPEIKLPNIITKEPESLLGKPAKYTLVVFYSPTCGHCQHELPVLDSVYEAVLKNKGVKVFTVATEGEEKAITDFLVKLKVDKKWTNTWDHEHISDYHSKYDVYSTPTLYLLDEKKIIRGKRIDHSNVATLIDMLERKEKKESSTPKK